MADAPWHSPAALAWLQGIVQERFGHSFELLLASDGACITVCLPGSVEHITLVVDGGMFARADSDLPCAQWDAGAEGWNAALPRPLQAPGAASLPTPLITSNEGEWRVGYDIFGLIYWMLTRQEEVGRTDLDAHGRFPGVASHAYKCGYLERPIVDEWLHLLGQVIIRVWPFISLKQHSFSMRVSHDVDAPSRFAFSRPASLLKDILRCVLKEKNLKSALLAPFIRMSSKARLHALDPYNTFDWLMDRSEKHGLVSAFYFICGRTDPAKDADYEIEDQAIIELMKRIHERGHEIGLHPSYASYQSPQIIQLEFERLRKSCQAAGIHQDNWGGRMHYLRWEQPTTMNGWDSAGISYDSTLGYADQPGFRCGTCFEYRGFDPVEKTARNIIIRPLVAMDVTVIDYLGLGVGEKAREKFLSLKQACSAVGGVFTVLWHNSCFSSIHHFDLYESVLSDFYE